MLNIATAFNAISDELEQLRTETAEMTKANEAAKKAGHKVEARINSVVAP